MSETTLPTDPNSPAAARVIPRPIDLEMRESYLRYSMSVIVSRALPDVRDGLKPVHRRVLFAADELSLTHDKPYKKSARIVGDVIGKYHPHGDTAVYDTLVRMAQDFSLRYPLIQGQGNFGSIDGDSPAAMRYTEARMTRFAELMLQDLDKDTVDFAPNYDDSLKEPSILPSAIPNLIVNGSTGIAVGMATNMAPHNLREVIDACCAVIDDPEIPAEGLLQYVKGPDFPTGAIIFGRSGIRDAILTGRGRIVVRARHDFEEIGQRQAIIFTEIPYQVNKARLLEKIAELVREKKVEGIADLRDESDRDGMRIVVEIKRDSHAEVVLNNLYKHTQLQDSFNINNLALVNGEPKTLNLKELIHHYIEHRDVVVRRRSEFELRKARERAHILEGYRIALDHLDEVIRMIRASRDAEEARTGLMERFGFTEAQARAILELTLRRLTGLEREKIEEEYAQLLARIAELEIIVADRAKRMAVVRAELRKVADDFGDARRTEIVDSTDEVSMEDLIADEPMVVTLTHSGYAKRQLLAEYREQGRGGRGVTGAGLQSDDFVDQIFVASTHAYLLCFTTLGRCYWLRVWNLPIAGKTAKGKALVNLLQLREGEKVKSVVPVRGFAGGGSIVFATRQGTINRIALGAFSNIRRDGIIGLALDEGDELVSTLLVQGEPDILLASQQGQAIRFPLSAFRALGRGTRGVRGISLETGDTVIGMVLVEPDVTILTVTEKGFGKRTKPEEYRVTNRGGKGIINLRVAEKNGVAVSVMSVREGDGFMVITKNGMVIRTDADSVRLIGRDSQGVMVIRLQDGDSVVDVAHVVCEDDSRIPSADIGDGEADAKDLPHLSETPLLSDEESLPPDVAVDIAELETEADQTVFLEDTGEENKE